MLFRSLEMTNGVENRRIAELPDGQALNHDAHSRQCPGSPDFAAIVCQIVGHEVQIPKRLLEFSRSVRVTNLPQLGGFR